MEDSSLREDLMHKPRDQVVAEHLERFHSYIDGAGVEISLVEGGASDDQTPPTEPNVPPAGQAA